MQTFLLRLEAVNFGASCYDTNDLSTVRGGSMMLSNVHELIRHQLPSELSGEPRSYGASHVIWEFTADNADAAEQVRVDLLLKLSENEPLKHATFVCAVIPKSDGSAEEVQQLRMLNRWSQFQKPTVTAPEVPVTANRAGQNPYCLFDRIRPGVAEFSHGKNRDLLSASTYARREYGRKQKQEFLRGFTGEQWTVVNDLSELTAGPGSDHPLSGKMAVIYIDGNQQSEMAAQLDLTELGRFRTYVRNKHREFLSALLQDIASTPLETEKNSKWHFWDRQEKEHQVRLETLLWGGDDILLVVPAWQGWPVVRKFYESAANWSFHGNNFTHATGIVFCSEKAPIQNVREFANQLVIQCKKQSRNGKYGDLIGYEVLESFDVPRADLDRWWADRLRRPSGNDEMTDKEIAGTLLFTPDEMAEIETMIGAVRNAVDDPNSKVSRRQIELQARRMQHCLMTDTEFDDQAFQSLATVTEFARLADLSIRSRLFHLTTLWDYIT